DPTSSHFVTFFFSLLPPHPVSTLFPYTTLFRSRRVCRAASPLPARQARQADRFRPSREGKPSVAAMPCHGPASRSVLEIAACYRSEEHTSELQSRGHLVCRLLLEKKKKK